MFKVQPSSRFIEGTERLYFFVIYYVFPQLLSLSTHVFKKANLILLVYSKAAAFDIYSHRIGNMSVVTVVWSAMYKPD